MRRAGLALALWTATAAADPPPIDAALDDAGRRGVPLLVELTADWCPPCRDFDQRVLPSLDVVAALKGVDFVRYDIERAPGDAAAARYHADGYPTFLIVEPDGTERLRRVGIGTGTRWFVALLAQARGQGTSTRDLEAAVAALPTNANARLRLGQRYRVTHRVADAVAQFRGIDQIPNVDRIVAARAAAELDEVSAADARLQAAVDAAIDFATRFPESPLASRRLALIAMSRRVDDARVRELVVTHLAAIKPSALPDAVHAAILAGLTAEAELAAHDWSIRAPHRSEPRLLLGELAIVRGDSKSGRAGIDAVCVPRMPDVDLWCHLLALAHPGVIPGVVQLRSESLAILDDLEEPGRTPAATADDLASMAYGSIFGNEVARVIDDAARDCRSAIDRTVHAMIAIELATQNRAPVHVHVYARDDGLARCLHDHIAVQPLPQAPPRLGGRISTIARVDGNGRRSRTDPVASGALLFALSRGGVDATSSLGAHAIVDTFSVTPDLRVLAAGETELGAATDGRASYVARALVGVGGARNEASLAMFTGIGASRYGAYAVELPIELRAKYAHGEVRGHLWLQTTYLLGRSSRQRPTGGFLEADELAAGIAASVPIRGVRFAFGLAIENRAAGTSGVVLAGLPLGGYF